MDDKAILKSCFETTDRESMKESFWQNYYSNLSEIKNFLNEKDRKEYKSMKESFWQSYYSNLSEIKDFLNEKDIAEDENEDYIENKDYIQDKEQMEEIQKEYMEEVAKDNGYPFEVWTDAVAIDQLEDWELEEDCA